MSSEFFSLQELSNPVSGLRELELIYEREVPSQTIRIRKDDWNDFLMEQLVAWAQMYPSNLKSHHRFTDFQKLLSSE